MPPRVAKRASGSNKFKPTDPALLPHFKPPSPPITKPTAPSSSTSSSPFSASTAVASFSLPASDSVQQETAKMEQRLHALKVSLLEEKRRREEQRRQQQEAAGGERKENQSQRDYLRDMRQRLERKKEATRDAVREVRERMETLGREYVAPRRRKEDEVTDLAAFQKASEQWLKDDEQESKAREQKQQDVAKPAAAAPAAAAAEEVDVQADGGIVISGEQDSSNTCSADPEFAKAREEWLNSLQAPPAAAAAAGSRPVTSPSSSPSPFVSTASLLDGPVFNEQESADEFQAARKAWLESLQPQAQPQPQQASRPTTAKAETQATAGGAAVRRLSCYQCYRLYAEGDGLRAGGAEGGDVRDVCSVECQQRYERSERIRSEKARSMREMERRLTQLRLQQQQLAQHMEAQQRQQVDDEDEDAETVQEEEKQQQQPADSAPTQTVALPVPTLPALSPSPQPAAPLLLSARRWTDSEAQPVPVVEFPADS